MATERIAFVLQGGGALGAYQAGAIEALAARGHHCDMVAGVSIGAINAALVCGNPPERRVGRLREFWEGVSRWFPIPPVPPRAARRVYDGGAVAWAMSFGIPGFFRPRWPWPPPLGAAALGLYDTAPLRDRLLELVDFDYLNTKGPRLCVQAVDLEAGDMTVFDSAATSIGPEHVMASGALPPGLPPVKIDGRLYWDGGIVSNTPLKWVMETADEQPMLVFQIDLFPAEGQIPASVSGLGHREKEIRFSSRTRTTTDRYRQLHAIQAAADRLAAKLPEGLANDPDLAILRNSGPRCPVSLVHLIYRKRAWEDASLDAEFSRLSMSEHWARGAADMAETLGHADWLARDPTRDGLQIFDLANRCVQAGPTEDAENHCV